MSQLIKLSAGCRGACDAIAFTVTHVFQVHAPVECRPRIGQRLCSHLKSLVPPFRTSHVSSASARSRCLRQLSISRANTVSCIGYDDVIGCCVYVIMVCDDCVASTSHAFHVVCTVTPISFFLDNLLNVLTRVRLRFGASTSKMLWVY